MKTDEPTLRTNASDLPAAPDAAKRLADDVIQRKVKIASVILAENVRKFYDQAAIVELAESIRNSGLIHRPLFRDTPSGPQLLVGSRRFSAFKYLAEKYPNEDWDSIPGDFREVPDEAIPTIQYLENDKREQLNTLEIADHVHKMRNSLNWDEKVIAQRFGWKSARSVRYYLQLAEAPAELKAFARSVAIEIPKTGADNKPVRDSKGVRVTTTHHTTPLGLAHLVELMGFHATASKHDKTQRSLDPNYELQADKLAIRLAKRAGLDQWSVERLKLAISSEIASLTGKPAEGEQKAPQITTGPTRLHLDVSGLTQPLPKAKLLEMKEDIVAVMRKLGYTSVVLTAD